MVAVEHVVGRVVAEDLGGDAAMKLVEGVGLEDLSHVDEPDALPVLHLGVLGDGLVDVPLHEELLVDEGHVSHHSSHA